MVAGAAPNLGAVTGMLVLRISLEDIAVPPAAAGYARRFAQVFGTYDQFMLAEDAARRRSAPRTGDEVPVGPG
jgi:hypothetical protein